MRLHPAALAAAVALACLVSHPRIEAQVKENLDLPFDAVGADEEEDDAPEVVNFYTTTLEGEAFFYVIDHSGSMMDTGELQRAKQEVLKNINEFSERVQFGVIFFAASATKFPTNGRPADADNANKQSARSFIQSIQRANGSCPLQGLQAALQMANQAKAQRKVVVYVGDGGGTCQGAEEAPYLEKTLAEVTSMNHQRIKINAIGVLDISRVAEQFLRKLASSNGGTYTRI